MEVELAATQSLMQLQPTRLHRVLDHPLFVGVDPKKVEAITARLRPVRVKRGAIVAGAGRPPRIYLVLDGVLHPYALTADGHRVVLEIVGPGGYEGSCWPRAVPVISARRRQTRSSCR